MKWKTVDIFFLSQISESCMFQAFLELAPSNQNLNKEVQEPGKTEPGVNFNFYCVLSHLYNSRFLNHIH